MELEEEGSRWYAATGAGPYRAPPPSAYQHDFGYAADLDQDASSSDDDAFSVGDAAGGDAYRRGWQWSEDEEEGPEPRTWGSTSDVVGRGVDRHGYSWSWGHWRHTQHRPDRPHSDGEQQQQQQQRLRGGARHQQRRPPDEPGARAPLTESGLSAGPGPRRRLIGDEGRAGSGAGATASGRGAVGPLWGSHALADCETGLPRRGGSDRGFRLLRRGRPGGGGSEGDEEEEAGEEESEGEEPPPPLETFEAPGDEEKDTVAAQVLKGRDPQGIPWERLQFTRQEVRTGVGWLVGDEGHGERGLLGVVGGVCGCVWQREPPTTIAPIGSDRDLSLFCNVIPPPPCVSSRPQYRQQRLTSYRNYTNLIGEQVRPMHGCKNIPHYLKVRLLALCLWAARP